MSATERAQLEQYIEDCELEEVMMDVTQALLKERPSNPKQFIVDFLEDELRGEATKKGNKVESTTVAGHHLIRLFESTRSISAEIVPKEAINIIIRETLKLLNCDRVSLFVYDEKIKMLVLTASNLTKAIRVQPGQGIAGTVFRTQETVNIPDCYADERFDPSFDRATGYHTKSLLAMPIVDFEGKTMGVVQAINKEEDGEFSQVDELLLGHLTQHVGITLRNGEVYKHAIVASERANGLLNMMQSLTQDLGTQSTILTITMHANQLVQADRCTVFLVDEKKDELWSVATDTGREIRIPKSKGIAGECATKRELINIKDAYEDARFNKEVDLKTGYRTQSILAVPVWDQPHRRVLAVIQMINKKEFDDEIGEFDEEETHIMETFAQFVGQKLTNSSLLSAGVSRRSEAGTAFGELDSGREKQKKVMESATILEEEEEGLDDTDGPL